MLVARKRADQERREAREERKLKRALKSRKLTLFRKLNKVEDEVRKVFWLCKYYSSDRL